MGGEWFAPRDRLAAREDHVTVLRSLQDAAPQSLSKWVEPEATSCWTTSDELFLILRVAIPGAPLAWLAREGEGAVVAAWGFSGMTLEGIPDELQARPYPAWASEA